MNESQNKSYQKIIAKYQKPQRWRSVWQLVNTLIPYAILWYCMFLSFKVSYWLTLALSVVAAGLLVRIFIIFHDCGHGSFFKSPKARHFWGFVTGVLIFTPYRYWWHKHAQHHATSGDLDSRGTGDVWTLTVKEYLMASRWIQIKYRFARNPLCLFVISPPILFLILQRIPQKNSSQREINSVHWTNLGILGMVMALSLLIGFKAYFMIQLPVIMISAAAGVWLFYVQHQFEGVYWERKAKWDYVTEALKGSSFYKLPKILQWFTGSIGYHHIHHLSPKIPNYYLERCHNDIPLFREIKPLTFLSSLKSLNFALWDEENHQLVGFDHIKGAARASANDMLAGLYKSSGFLAIAQQLLKLSDRFQRGLILIYADPDHLKRINDNYGRNAKDRVLISIADVIKKTFHDPDVIGRFGGDEFALLALETKVESLDTVHECLKKNLEMIKYNIDSVHRRMFGFGITYYNPQKPQTIEELLARADILM